MTDADASLREKFHAVLFSLLMVTSMGAGVVTLSGVAGADVTGLSGASATDLTDGSNEISVNVTSDEGNENVTFDLSGLQSGVFISDISASGSDNLTIVDSTIVNNGDSATDARVAVNVTGNSTTDNIDGELSLTVDYDLSGSNIDKSVDVTVDDENQGTDAGSATVSFNLDAKSLGVTDASTDDVNDNGAVDTILVTFNDTLDSTTVDQGDFSLSTGSVEGVSVDGATANLSVSGFSNTSATPDVTVSAGGVEDEAGNTNPGSTTTTTDGANPVVVDSSLNQTLVNNADAPATIQANVTFSENLSTVGSVELQNGNTRTFSGSVSADTFSGTVTVEDNNEDTVNDLSVSGFTDDAGNSNELFTQSDAVTIDTDGSLSLDDASTADLDNDGTVDTVNVTFSDDVNDDTVISAIESDDFNLKEGTVTGLVDGGDDDATVSLSVTDVGNTGATDEVTLFSNSIEDTAGNPGPDNPTGLAVSDGADPVVLSLTVNDTDDGFEASDSVVLNGSELPTGLTVNATFSEDLSTDPSLTLVNDADGNERVNVAESDGGDNQISIDTTDITGAPDDGTAVNVVLSNGGDGAGNDVEFNETRITVDDVNPAVTVDSPVLDGIVGESVNISSNVSVSDGNGIEQIELAVDDGDGLEQINSFSSVSELETALENFDTTQFEDGPITIQVNATDLAGNTNSDSGTLDIDNTKPQVTIVAPAETQAAQSDSTLTVEADVTEANEADPATVTLTDDEGLEAVYEVQVSELQNGVDLRLNASQNADAGGAELPVQSRTDENFTFDTQTLYDLSVTVNDSTGKSTTEAQADALFLDDTDPANFSLIAPDNDDPQEVSGGDPLVIAYGYTENNTASVTVNLTDKAGNVVRTIEVDESQYTDSGVIKSFELAGDVINFGDLDDGRYNVSVTVTDDAGNKLTDSTTDAPIAVNDFDGPNGEITFNGDTPTASADLNETSEQVTVNVTYNVSVQDLTDAGDLDQVEAQLEDVTISSADKVVTASLTFYDESAGEYREIPDENVPLGTFEGVQRVDNQTVTATATVGVNVTEVFGDELNDGDRVLGYTVSTNAGSTFTVKATGNEDVVSQSGTATISSGENAAPVNQDPLEPRIESVEVVGPDTGNNLLNITFTRPVQAASGDLTSSDFGYQNVNDDEPEFIDSVVGINGDTITVALDSDVTAGDIGSDIVSLQDGNALETDPADTAISPVAVSPDSSTVVETDAPDTLGVAAVGQNASVLTVTFDQPVVAADGGALTADNVTYSGTAEVIGVDHDAETDTVTITLNGNVTSGEAGSAEVTFDAVSDRFNNTAEGFSTVVEDFVDPSDIAIDSPSERTIVQSSVEGAAAADDGTRFLDVTYRYVENIPDGPADVNVTLTQQDGDDSYTFNTVNDVEFVNENTTKTITLDLNETDGLADGTYSVEVEVTDQAGNDETASTDAVVVVNDEAPELTNVDVTESSDTGSDDDRVGPDETINVTYDYADATNATTVQVHIVETEVADDFTSDFQNVSADRYEIVTIGNIDNGASPQEVQVDLSNVDLIQDNEDYEVFVTAVDESGFTNLNISADDPIEQASGQDSGAVLDVNAGAPSVDDVETDAGARTVTVTFSEPVVAADGELARDDFAYQDVSGVVPSQIESVEYGDSQSEIVLTLDADVTGEDLGTDLIEVRDGAIVDTDGDDRDNARAVPLTAVALNDTTAPTVSVDAGSVNAQNAESFEVTVSTEPTSEPVDVTVTVTGPEGETASTQTSVTGSDTVSLNVSTLADGEVTIDVEVTDAGGNSDAASTTVAKDTVAPEIVRATANAGTNTISVTLNEDVTNVVPGAFTVSSPVHEVEEVSGVFTPEDGTTVVVLNLNRTVPAAAINTSDVQLSALGVTDTAGNNVNNAVNLTDVDAPAIESVSADRDSSTVTVQFTEIVDGGGDGLSASDFVYADNNGAGASGIEGVEQVGPQTVELTLNESLTPSDLAEDTIAPASDSVFDTVGNAAATDAVGLGFEASLTVTAEENTVTVRVVTAQDISDAISTLQVTEQNQEFAELEGFELNDRLETTLNASDFSEVEPGVFEATIDVPRDDVYTVGGTVSSEFRAGSTAVDTSAPEPTDAVILSVTSEAQLDDTRDTTRLRVLFDEPIDASEISPDDITIEGFEGDIVEVQDAGVLGAVEVIVEGDLQTGDSPEISFAGSSYTDLSGTAGVEDGSTVIHTDVLQLDQEVNFVSVPAAAGSLDISELPLDQIESISRYNAETGEFETFVPGAPGNAFSTLEGGEGYIVRMNDGATASVAINVANEPTGQDAPNAVELSEGFNLVGHYQEDQQSVTKALSSVTAGQSGQFEDTVFTVLSHDEEAGGFTYESFRAGEFNTMDDGEAYWVFVTDDETYTEAPFEEDDGQQNIAGA